MIILGLTGSIGMGKSTTAQMFMDEGIPVYDADAAVHKLYSAGGAAVGKIEIVFPGVLDSDGNIDRQKLGKVVLGDRDAMKRLEAIVHPLVQAEREKFLNTHLTEKAILVVLDIPLLFETGSENLADKILVVTAPEDVQKQRVMSRAGMTIEKFESILNKQLPDAEKRKKADFIIDTNQGMDQAREDVRGIIQTLKTGTKLTEDS